MGYTKKKVDELKELCKQKGLSTEGFKPELIDRLNRFNKEGNSERMNTAAPVKPKKQPEMFPATVDSKRNPYLHLKARNLPTYFNFGYIYPLDLEESEIYRTENREKDILTWYPQHLVLSHSAINSFDANDVLVELLIDEIEYSSLDDLAIIVIKQPLPISRIKGIHFKDDAQRKLFISSASAFHDCYIPETLCKVFSGEPGLLSLNHASVNLPENNSIEKWRVILDRFDRLIGMFAYIKNVGIFYATRENRLDEYLKSYFGALSLINSIPELQTFKENVFLRPLIFSHNLEITNDQRLLFKLIIDRIRSNEGFSVKQAIDILENIAEQNSKVEDKRSFTDLVDAFKELDRYTLSFKNLLEKDVIRRNLPLLTLLFLAKFPNKARMNSDKQAVRNVFLEEENAIPLHIAESILGTLGLYYGYKNMIKEDTNLVIRDRNFQHVSKQVQSIKFKMNCYLDRFTIESCFHFAINETQLSNTYSFLKGPENVDNHIPNLYPDDFEYIAKLTEVLQYKVLSITRVSQLEKIIAELADTFSEKVNQTSYLATFFLKYNKLDLSYISNQLKNFPQQFPFEELKQIIDIEKKNTRKNK